MECNNVETIALTIIGLVFMYGFYKIIMKTL